MPAKKKSPSRAKSGNGAPKRDRVNSLDLKALEEYFEGVHEQTDKMESRNAATRQAIGKIYERASADLKLSVSAIRSAFRKERTQMKELERAREKGTAKDKESYERIASAYGLESPIGAWAATVAAEIVDEGGDDDEGDEEVAETEKAEKVGKVVPLHGPS